MFYFVFVFSQRREEREGEGKEKGRGREGKGEGKERELREYYLNLKSHEKQEDGGNEDVEERGQCHGKCE